MWEGGRVKVSMGMRHETVDCMWNIVKRIEMNIKLKNHDKDFTFKKGK